MADNIDEINWTLLLEGNNLDKVNDPTLNPQQVLSISDETLKKYYSVAFELYQEKKFSDAQDAFTFLTFLNPEYPCFWMGLGSSAQAQQDFEIAIMAYEVLEQLDPEDPPPFANAYQCYTAIGDLQKANECYQKFLSLSNNKPEYNQLMEQIQQYRNNLETIK